MMKEYLTSFDKMPKRPKLITETEDDARQISQEEYNKFKQEQVEKIFAKKDSKTLELMREEEEFQKEVQETVKKLQHKTVNKGYDPRWTPILQNQKLAYFSDA